MRGDIADAVLELPCAPAAGPAQAVELTPSCRSVAAQQFDVLDGQEQLAPSYELQALVRAPAASIVFSPDSGRYRGRVNDQIFGLRAVASAMKLDGALAPGPARTKRSPEMSCS